jgi:hypothetical protein
VDIPNWASVLTILIAGIGLTVYIQRRVSGLDRRLDHLMNAIQVIGRQLRDLLALFGQTIRILHVKSVMSDEELRSMLAAFAEMASRGMDTAIERLSAQANPLTPEEANTSRQLR